MSINELFLLIRASLEESTPACFLVMEYLYKDKELKIITDEKIFTIHIEEEKRFVS